MPTAGLGGLGGSGQPPHKHRSSLFMTVATLLFIASIAAAGSMFFWKSLLLTSQESYKKQLADREKQFNANLIEELKRQDVKISFAQQLIKQHIAASQIFSIVGLLTTEQVRFLSMDLSAGATPGEAMKVSLKGYGTDFIAVAFQSDVLGKLERYGLRNIVRNPILSDPSLNSNRSVSFGLTATINPDNLSYEKSMNPSANTDSASSTTP